MTKVLVATEKPFSKVAVDGIKEITDAAGYELSLLEKYTEKSQLLAAVADADALIIRSDKVDAEVLNAAPKLKIVVRAGAGYDNIDLEAATAHKVVAMNTPGQNANSVAELVFGLLVFGVRNFFNGTSGTEEELFDTCDIVSLHIPATAETRQSINYDLVKRLKKGGILVNTARKEVIDEAGLLRLMEERPDLKYLTDIKPDSDAEFAARCEGRYFATPKKMGAQTAEANVNAGLAAARQIVDFIEKGITKFQVNQ